jgi:hypothetical protein
MTDSAAPAGLGWSSGAPALLLLPPLPGAPSAATPSPTASDSIELHLLAAAHDHGHDPDHDPGHHHDHDPDPVAVPAHDHTDGEPLSGHHLYHHHHHHHHHDEPGHRLSSVSTTSSASSLSALRRRRDQRAEAAAAAASSSVRRPDLAGPSSTSGSPGGSSSSLGRTSAARWTTVYSRLLPAIFLAFIAGCIFFGVFTYREFSNAEHDDARIRFEERSKDLVADIERTLVLHMERIRVAGRGVSIMRFPTFSRFSTIVYPLVTTLTIHLVAWAPLVQHRDRAALEQSYTAEFGTTFGRNFTICEKFPNGTVVPSPSRPAYAPAIYIEPVGTNAPLLFLDFLGSQDYSSIYELAQTSGEMTVSDAIRLSTFHEETTGFIVAEPVRLCPFHSSLLMSITHTHTHTHTHISSPLP